MIYNKAELNNHLEPTSTRKSESLSVCFCSTNISSQFYLWFVLSSLHVSVLFVNKHFAGAYHPHYIMPRPFIYKQRYAHAAAVLSCHHTLLFVVVVSCKCVCSCWYCEVTNAPASHIDQIFVKLERRVYRPKPPHCCIQFKIVKGLSGIFREKALKEASLYFIMMH